MLCCNKNRTEKLKPLIIHKFKIPRCFNKFIPTNLVDYHFNKTAWMTINIFSNFINSLNLKMQSQHRKIVLLLDNAPCHNLRFEPKNIKLIFLQKNSIVFTQPFDSGIIKNLKSYYIKF